MHDFYAWNNQHKNKALYLNRALYTESVLFERAQKVRHLLINKVNDILKEYDAFIAPCSGRVKSEFVENSDNVTDEIDIDKMIIENHLGIANFAGLPSLSIPVGIDNGFPFDFNITGRAFEEVNVFNIAYALENELNLKNLSVIKEDR